MNDWQVVCPYLAPKWNIQQLIDNMGEIPVPFLLIDNSPEGDTRSMNIPKGIEVEYHPENLGTSMSWNLGLMRGAKWTLILSVSARFGDGGLTKYIDRAQHWANDFGFLSPIGGHCHVIGRQMVREVGLFDGAIFPAYKEDSDLGYRLRLSLDLEGAIPHFRPEGLYIIGSAVTVRSAPWLDQRIPERVEYYERKWGASEGKEIYKTPFNDPNNSIAYWPMPEWFKGKGLPEWDWHTRW
jgi:hypothetical protein